jgi:hypothetical protein
MVLTACVSGAWSQTNHVIVRPREIHDVLINPGVGITTFQRFNGDALHPGRNWSEAGPESKLEASTKPDFPETSIAYMRWFWSQIEPERSRRGTCLPGLHTGAPGPL